MRSGSTKIAKCGARIKLLKIRGVFIYERKKF
jgi:hypothetical protein